MSESICKKIKKIEELKNNYQEKILNLEKNIQSLEQKLKIANQKEFKIFEKKTRKSHPHFKNSHVYKVSTETSTYEDQSGNEEEYDIKVYTCSLCKFVYKDYHNSSYPIMDADDMLIYKLKQKN